MTDPSFQANLEQLRDIWDGRDSYNSDDEWHHNMDAAFTALEGVLPAPPQPPREPIPFTAEDWRKRMKGREAKAAQLRREANLAEAEAMHARSEMVALAGDVGQMSDAHFGLSSGVCKRGAAGGLLVPVGRIHCARCVGRINLCIITPDGNMRLGLTVTDAREVRRALHDVIEGG